MPEDTVEGKIFATFERREEFINAQNSLLSLDLHQVPSPAADKKEWLISKRLSTILDEYQEQSYLLDPFLEELVAPVVQHLKAHAKECVSDHALKPAPRRVERVTLLLYSYIKCRGYKAIIRYFPHEITDLSIALDYSHIPNCLVHDDSQWALRYIILIWLSLICMIPFDLAQFDEIEGTGTTAKSIEAIAKRYIGKAGLERDGAALLLSRLYMRKDTSSGLNIFITQTNEILHTEIDVFTSIGLLKVLCEVAKSGSAEQVRAHCPHLLELVATVDKKTRLSNNTVLRKLKTKLASRVALRVLPARANANRRKGRTLHGENFGEDDSILENEADVAEEVEVVLEQLLSSLQDKDTIVRYSAAKGIARIAERLSTDFANQLTETVMRLFSIHSITAASLYDIPAIAESTWHGACLACAEIARRGLVSAHHLQELVGWLTKALLFDLRKGAHSIGSNVRDAAAYVLWALARTYNPADLIPYADQLARRLVTAALYDREIHIRRAASAAFQEHVGRTNLFPQGIDVLGKTDFYAVSVRRNAFLVAAPRVAEHLVYRQYLFDHILDVVLRHWDATMRELGSQSLRSICLLDIANLGPQATTKAARLLESFDANDLHGGLLALIEIALAYRSGISDLVLLEHHLQLVLEKLSLIPEEVLMKPRNELVTAAACRLIASTLTYSEVQSGQPSTSTWNKVIDYSMRHRAVLVQEAGADAIAAISKLGDCSTTLTK